MTARVGGVSRPGGEGSPNRWRGVKSLCAVCGTQGPGGFGYPAGRIGDRGDREIVYVPNVYVPFPAPRSRKQETSLHTMQSRKEISANELTSWTQSHPRNYIVGREKNNKFKFGGTPPLLDCNHPVDVFPFVLWKCPVCPADALSNLCGTTHKSGRDVPDVPHTDHQIQRVPNPPGANPLVAERATWRSSQSCVTGGQQPVGNPCLEVFAVLCDRGSAACWKSLQIPVIASAHLGTPVRPLCDPNSHSWGRLCQLPGG